jgi:hypothetical protein
VDGRIVYADARDYSVLCARAPQPRIEPEWSPVARFGGYQIGEQVGKGAWKVQADSDNVARAAKADPNSQVQGASSSSSVAGPAHASIAPASFFEHGHDC